MVFTMGQAAKEVGVSKPTLSRAIKSGKISASKNSKGGWDIDPAELFRVYPRNTDNGSANGSDNGDMKQNATPAVTPPETAVLQVQIDSLRERLDDMKAMLEREREVADREREQADKWRETAEHNQRLLADQRPRRGWFGLGKAS